MPTGASVSRATTPRRWPSNAASDTHAASEPLPLSKLEKDKHNPTVVGLYEIAQALGVSQVELVRED